MGRNARFGDGPAPDLEPHLVLARDDVRVVTERAGELWEHVDATKPADPLLVKPKRTAATDSPALYVAPGPIRSVYMDVVAEIARAHEAIGRNTDVPTHWPRLAKDRNGECKPLTGERAPLHPLEEFRGWCKVLDGMLQWCQGQDFRPPEASAVLEACEHVAAARRHIEDLWPANAASELVERRCANKVNGCRNAARKNGTKCGTCANYHSEHGRDRIVGANGRAA